MNQAVNKKARKLVKVSEKIKSQRKDWCLRQLALLEKHPSNAVFEVTL